MRRGALIQKSLEAAARKPHTGFVLNSLKSPEIY
jgi:hypothetical protein